MNMSLSAFAPENLVSRDGFGSRPVPRQPAYLHTCTQAEPGAYLRDSPRVYNTQRARHNKEDQKYYSPTPADRVVSIHSWRPLGHSTVWADFVCVSGSVLYLVRTQSKK